jgi:hypothetical protein
VEAYTGARGAPNRFGTRAKEERMREATVRWALGFGAVAALVGAVGQLIGGLLVPPRGVSSINEVVRYLLLAVPVALVAFCGALGLAYFAGLKVERTRPSTPPSDEPPRWADERIESSFAGAIVMGLFCVFSALVAVLINLRIHSTTTAGLLGQRAIQTVLLMILGFGMGALGARARSSRRLLDLIAPVATPAAPAPTEPPAIVAPDEPAPPAVPSSPAAATDGQPAAPASEDA